MAIDSFNAKPNVKTFSISQTVIRNRYGGKLPALNMPKGSNMQNCQCQFEKLKFTFQQNLIMHNFH